LSSSGWQEAKGRQVASRDSRQYNHAVNTTAAPEGSLDKEQFLPRMRRDLELKADPEYRVRAAEYCQREVDRFLGVRTPIVRQIGASYFHEIKSLSIDAILQLCERLLETAISEHRTIAFDWSFRCRRHYRPEHFDTLERWLEVYVDGWGSCDDLCTHALGDFILRYPEFLPWVKEWSRSENRWQRRASAVTLIYGARRGRNLAHVFEVADALLTDPDDMVQKGYGWMLKVASKTHPDEVFQYVMRQKKEMPRTALRYAIEKMPEAQRRRAMEK
jgi:3-methyladenine DNA glycosylase AlkD